MVYRILILIVSITIMSIASAHAKTVTLIWDVPDSIILPQKYIIYRADGTNPYVALPNPSVHPLTEYIDTAAPDTGKYCYVATAVYEIEGESQHSNIVCLPPAHPRKLKVK